MTIAPIVHTIRVKAAPARAFDLFTSRIGDWWPKAGGIGKAPHAAIVIEPKVDGRWFERDGDGRETNWGKVLAWEPPLRLLLGWQINATADSSSRSSTEAGGCTGGWGYDPNLLTEVELTFTPADGGGTLVRLEHRNLERFGVDAVRFAEKLNGGWPTRLREFAAFADTHS